MFDFKRLKRSFAVAIKGIIYASKGEQTFKIQLIFAIIAIFLAFYLNLNPLEKAIIFLAIGTVLGMELINTQIEKILDLIQPNHDQKVRVIKDLSAAAVLIVALASLILGILIFLPKIINKFF